MIEVNGRKVAEWNIPYKKDDTLLAAIDGCKFITVSDVWTRRGVITFIFDKNEMHYDMYRTRFGGRGIVSAGFIEVSSSSCLPFAVGKSTSIEGEPEATEEDTKTIQAWYEEKVKEDVL